MCNLKIILINFNKHNYNVKLFEFVHAQMGSRSFTELRVWRLRANRRPYTNNVPHTSGTTWSTRSDVFG